MIRLRRLLTVSNVALAGWAFILLAMVAAPLVALPSGSSLEAAMQDQALADRAIPRCVPTSTTPYLYYGITDGTHHCASYLPRTTVPLGAGASSSLGSTVAGLTDATTTTSGTVQNTEYTLNSVSLPASALNVTGRAVRVVFWGTTSANANAKNLKIYVGSTAVATVTGSTANAKDFYGEVTLVRTGASTQRGVAFIQVDTDVAATMATAALTQNDNAAIVIALKSANTAAAAASASGKGMVATFIH